LKSCEDAGKINEKRIKKTTDLDDIFIYTF